MIALIGNDCRVSVDDATLAWHCAAPYRQQSICHTRRCPAHEAGLRTKAQQPKEDNTYHSKHVAAALAVSS